MAQMPATDPLRTELAARMRGEAPRRPFLDDRVRWGGQLYYVWVDNGHSAVLCPQPGCLPFTHEHLTLGPLALAFLRWNADAREFG